MAPLGHHSATAYDAGFYLHIWESGQNRFERNSLSGLCVRGSLTLELFANAITTSGNSIVGSANLITKIYFPRPIIPLAAVCAGLVDFAVAFPMLVVLMFLLPHRNALNVLLVVPLVLLTTLLAVAVGMWISAINAKYRDVKFAMPFVVQILMYLSPVAYPSSVVPAKWRTIYDLNPFVGIIDGYRSALFGRAFDWKALTISMIITLGFLTYASRQFQKMEKGFADII